MCYHHRMNYIYHNRIKTFDNDTYMVDNLFIGLTFSHFLISSSFYIPYFPYVYGVNTQEKAHMFITIKLLSHDRIFSVLSCQIVLTFKFSMHYVSLDHVLISLVSLPLVYCVPLKLHIYCMYVSML